MSIELTRREFLKIVFATTSLVAVTGVTTMWPSNELTRPIMEPVYLEVDDYGYIIDPGFDYWDMCPPKSREYHSLKLAQQKPASSNRPLMRNPVGMPPTPSTIFGGTVK